MPPFANPNANSATDPAFYFGAVDAVVPAEDTPQPPDEPRVGDSMSLHLMADLERQLLQHRANAVFFEWSPVWRSLNFAPEVAQRIAQRVAVNGTNFAREAVACGAVDEYRLFNAIADELRLPFLSSLDHRGLLLGEEGCLLGLSKHDGLPLASYCRADGQLIYLLARMDIGLDALKARIARHPDLARNLYVATPSGLRSALRQRARNRLLFDAQHRLTVEKPEFSARNVLNAGQGAVAGALIAILAICLAMAAEQTILVIQIVGMVSFLACVLLRLLAIRSARPLKFDKPQMPNPADLPVYSVLVALYREREVITQLLISLGNLQWPHGKLEIKLVCEEDDAETLEVLQAHQLRPIIEVVKVPSGGPRTKPKALAYALPLCSGELVTLYDAEDRPNPMQLVEAWRAFENDTPDLACVQAPLVVTNENESLLSLMFAFEYAALFRGLLPWLAQKDAVLPLGGTSNHFRRSALIDVGGWDGHNVTEDADLGLRLKRFGYRIGVIALPTLEEAPEDLRTWMPQRIRWYKGWLQTWLVHMRDPARLWRELGPASFALTQILFLGTLLSVLIHPIALMTVGWLVFKLMQSDVVVVPHVAMALGGVVTIGFGYGAFLALGWATLSRLERRHFWKVVLLMPVYWLLLSLAAWRALSEIYRRPHLWNKTPHQQVRPKAQLARARRHATPGLPPRSIEMPRTSPSLPVPARS